MCSAVAKHDCVDVVNIVVCYRLEGLRTLMRRIEKNHLLARLMRQMKKMAPGLGFPAQELHSLKSTFVHLQMDVIVVMRDECYRNANLYVMASMMKLMYFVQRDIKVCPPVYKLAALQNILSAVTEALDTVSFSDSLPGQ